MNGSNVARSSQPRFGGALDLSSHALDYDDKNYTKHVVGLEAVWRW